MKGKAAILVGLAILLSAGAIWQPFDPDAVDMAQRHASLSFGHPLGTDHLGRDVLSRVMVAGWRTAAVLMVVSAIGFIGGTALGCGAAIIGGRWEVALLRIAEIPIVLPSLVVAMAAAALFGLGPVSAGLALGLAGIGPYALLTHSLTLRVMAQPYILAARAMGVGGPALAGRHIFPNVAPTLMVHVGSNAGRTVVAYASLAFLGLGADTSRPDWGAMLFEYRIFMFDDPALMLWAGAPIAVCVTVLNAIFDPLRGIRAPRAEA
ncbi:MAG: ABC transporter permease [Rhodospirillales bacterium]|nr:ABC transporter permease [Rhodospirillales bacterium]